MPALFIGRFQPFHLGHLSVIKKALKENDHLYIGIGSTEENFQPANPFTCSERFQMLEAALREAKISKETYDIIPVPNINHYALWTRHVDIYIPPYEKIYTGSEVIKELYERYNATLKNPYKIIMVKKELKISSTLVRKQMLENKKWEELVPKSVANLLKKWGAVEKIKNIQGA